MRWNRMRSCIPTGNPRCEEAQTPGVVDLPPPVPFSLARVAQTVDVGIK
jgi:hypothetical protein